MAMYAEHTFSTESTVQCLLSKAYNVNNGFNKQSKKTNNTIKVSTFISYHLTLGHISKKIKKIKKRFKKGRARY